MNKSRIDKEQKRLEGLCKISGCGELHAEESNDYFLQLKEAQNAVGKYSKNLMEPQRLAGFGSWEFDVSANKVYWSDEMKVIFGYSTNESLDYEGYLNLLHPEDWESVYILLKESLKIMAGK